MTIPPLVRNAIASVLGLIGAYALFVSIGVKEWHILGLPLGCLVAASVLIHRSALGAQVLARAVWWANLAFGALLALTGGGHERTAGGLLALSCGSALLLVGRRALGETNARGVAVPPALRSMLLLLMIFALADAQTFLLFGSIGVMEKSAKLGPPALMISIGVGYVIGFVGLYRLELWGAILNIVISIGVLGAVITTPFIRHHELDVFLGVLAGVHILVAAPVVLAAVRGKDLPGLPPVVRATLANLIIAGLMLASAAAWLTRGSRW